MAQQANLPGKLLVVDDDPSDLTAIKNMLGAESIAVTTCPDWQSAIYAFNNTRFDMAIVELELSGLPGAALIQKWRSSEDQERKRIAIIVATNMQLTSADSALIAELGDVGQIKKPFKWANVMNVMVKIMIAKEQNRALEKIETSIIRPLVDNKQYKEAIQIAESKVAKINAKGLEVAAVTFEDCGEFEMALTSFEKLRNAQPTNLRYLNAIGRLNLKLGNLSIAKECLEKANQLAPSNISRLNQMAELYLRSQDPHASIAKFKEIMELTPENTDIKFGFFERLQDAGYEEEAQKFCKEASTPMELIRFYNNSGVMFSKSQDYDGAIKEYDRAVSFARGNKELFRILYNKAIALINLKSPDRLTEAYQVLEHCVELNPDFDKARERMQLLSAHKPKQSA